ncbi:MAG TPA: hypothetical protein VF972_03115 [Actinomycetota bacterium]
MLFAHRRRQAPSDEVRRAATAFRSVIRSVDEAKTTLLLGVPSGRGPRLPLAEALAGFERVLALVGDEMASWRTSDVEEQWLACVAALGGVSASVDALRIGRAELPDAYEALVPVLDDLLAPLDAFTAASERFRLLGA